MANINAYGFVTLRDMYAQRVTQVGINRVWTAIQESAAEYNRVSNALLSGWTERTIVAQEQIELPGSGTLQPLDEDGNPKPVVPSGSYQVAFPIQGAGTAWGTNRVTRELLTVEEANRFTVDAFQRDANWMIRHILAATFTNTTWTFNDKVGANGSKGLGDITIQPLANNDSVVYVRRGFTTPSADNHYLAQANAISDTDNPFPIIYDELMEHPSNMGNPVVVYVPTNLKTAIMGLTGFVENPDPDIQVGISSDTLRRLIAEGPGDEVLGKVDKCWIIEWGALPDSYMIAKVMGLSFLRMREYPVGSLQGFFPENHSPDGAHLVNRFIRYAGFGCYNRVAAVVYRVGNASYAIPSGYTAPLPV